MSSAQLTALRLAILGSGAFPRLEQTPLDPVVVYPGNPIPPGSGGYDLTGATRAQVTIALQQDGSRRQAWVSFAIPDLAATYTLDVNGTSVAFNASLSSPADLEELIVEWAAALNADANMQDIVLALPDPTDPEVLLVQWRVGGGPIDLAVSGTTASFTLTTEREGAVVGLYNRSSAVVSLSDENEAKTARERLAGWQAHYIGLTRAAWTLTEGAGVRTTIPCEGLSALLVVATQLAGVTGDAVTGGASRTLAYTTPWACIAPCAVE